MAPHRANRPRHHIRQEQGACGGKRDRAGNGEDVGIRDRCDDFRKTAAKYRAAIAVPSMRHIEPRDTAASDSPGVHPTGYFMPIEQIIVLALIQGITEFLPISSSGHLMLVPLATGWADQGLMTDVMIHMGSFLAVVVYFWRDVLKLIARRIRSRARAHDRVGQARAVHHRRHDTRGDLRPHPGQDRLHGSAALHARTRRLERHHLRHAALCRRPLRPDAVKRMET